MIFTEEQLNTAFYDWIKLVHPSLPVQRLEDNGPREDLPYISYRIDGFNLIGPYETRKPDNTGFATVKGVIELPLYIQSHGVNSLTLLQELQRSVYDIDIQEFFNTSVCIGFVSVISQPISIPILRDTKYEPRGSLDLLFRTHDQFTTETGVIETVEYDLSLTDNVNTETENVTIQL